MGKKGHKIQMSIKLQFCSSSTNDQPYGLGRQTCSHSVCLDFHWEHILTSFVEKVTLVPSPTFGSSSTEIQTHNQRIFQLKLALYINSRLYKNPCNHVYLTVTGGKKKRTETRTLLGSFPTIHSWDIAQLAVHWFFCFGTFICLFLKRTLKAKRFSLSSSQFHY